MVISESIRLTRLPVNDEIFISPLTEADTEAYWQLYQNALVQRYFFDSPFEPNESSSDFISRIMRSCDHIWTIRKYDDPGEIIGDCALHDWNKQTGEITIGCALHPSHWGEGIMTSVMRYAINFATEDLGVSEINGITSKYNDYAIRLMHRLGFVEVATDGPAIQFQLLVDK